MTNETLSPVLLKENGAKIEFLDSIRGLMAINVILCHFVIFYYPETFYEEFAKTDGGFLSWFYYTPLSVLVNGNIAVQYFFVLTGFLVGKTIFTKHLTGRMLCKRCVNRYFRLIPVIFGATFVTLIAILLNLHHHHQIAEILPYTDLVNDYWDFEPTVINFLNNVFLKPFIKGSDYVGPFWTIPYEFFGYIFLMIICFVSKESKWRRVIYIACAAFFHIFFDNNYIIMLLGVVVADLYYNNSADTTVFSGFYSKIIKKKWVIALCGLIGTFFAVCPMNFTTTHAFLKYIPMAGPGVIRGTGMALVVYAVLYTPAIQKILSNRVFKGLGKISFSVYAFHWPIMLTLQTWLFDLFYSKMSYDAAAVLAFVITLPMIYLFSYFAWRILEYNKNYDVTKYLDRFSDFIEKKITKQNEIY